MNTTDINVDALLKRLHLANARRTWRDMIARAEKEAWSCRDFLALLVAEEVAHRQQTRIQRVSGRSGFPFFKTVDDFDFTYQSTVKLSLLGSALSPDFVTDGRSLILHGKSGRGKTHIAVAIGYRAIQNGFDTLFVTAAELIEDLSVASRDGQLANALVRYVSPNVLIVDEVGYLTYSHDAANVLYHVVTKRHQAKRSMLFTSNKHPDSWGAVLHDDDLAAAIVDRVLERGRLLHLDGPSMRTKHLGLDAPAHAAAGSLPVARISGIDSPEFPEPTRWRLGLIAFVVAAVVVVASFLMSREDLPTTTDAKTLAKPTRHGSAAGRSPGEDPKGSLELEGQVIDEQQQPIAGADVRLSPGDLSATTDASGSFVFDQLVARQYRVSAAKDELYAGPASVNLSGATEPLILRMRRGATLVVHVFADRAPVAHARVVLDKRTAVLTDIEGIARVRGIGPPYHDGQVFADGWAPAFIGMFTDEDPGGVIERTVTLQRGARVDGTVLGADDKLVPDADVVFWDAVDGRWIDETTTDQAGAWHFDAMAAGRYHVRASSKMFAPAADLTLELDGTTARRDVVVHVDTGGQLIGTVVDGSGSPVPDALVRAVLPGVESRDDRTNANGVFEMRGLRLGTYDVAARKLGRASPAARVTLARDRPIQIRLVVQDANIAGTVVDTKGNPVVEAQVVANAISRSSTTSQMGVATDVHGHFDLGGLEPGEYAVSARWPDQRALRDEPESQQIKTGEQQMKIVLAPQSSITGRVVLDGKPMPYFGLLVTTDPDFPGNGLAPTGVSAPDGRFTVRGVARGTWGIVLLGPGTALKAFKELKVEDGKTIDLGDIAMEHGQRISGRVRDSNGAAIAGARIIIGRGLKRDGSRLQEWFMGDYEATTNSGGEYVFDGISANRRPTSPPQISATHYSAGSSLLRDLPEGDATLDFVLLGSGRIEGFVDGFADHYAFVNAVRSEEPSRSRWTSVNAAGKFVFDDVPAGDYAVSVEPQHGESISSATVTVAANQKSTVRLVMHSTTVRVIVKVARGQSDGLTLAPPGDGAPTPDSLIRPSMVLDDEGIFEHVDPGSYRVLVGGKIWTPIVVATSPPEQSIEIRAQP